MQKQKQYRTNNVPKEYSEHEHDAAEDLVPSLIKSKRKTHSTNSDYCSYCNHVIVRNPLTFRWRHLNEKNGRCNEVFQATNNFPYHCECPDRLCTNIHKDKMGDLYE